LGHNSNHINVPLELRYLATWDWALASKQALSFNQHISCYKQQNRHLFTHQLTVLCDLTVGLPDHAPIQFCSMMWCHQTQFCLLSCTWQWYHHVFTPNIFKQYATPCPLILVATVRLVPTTSLAHISPELKCHKAESWTVCSCSRQNCLQHHSYVASTLSCKVGGTSSAQADLVELYIVTVIKVL